MRRLIYGVLGLVLFFLLISELYNYFYSGALEFQLHPANDAYQDCLHMKRNNQIKTVRILVISGGGISGLIPLTYLKYLEQKTQQPTHQLFDFFVGTSTGSIIISLLNSLDKRGKTMSAAELYTDYINLSKQVLYASFWRKLLTLNGLIAPKFDNARLYKIFLDNPYAGTMFYKLKNYVAVTNYWVERLSLTTVQNWNCTQEQVYVPLSQILVGATAAPLIFAPVVYTEGREFNRATYIDGAVVANRPSLQAVGLVKAIFPKAEKLIIVSLGTGKNQIFEYHLNNKTVQHWGLVQWIEPLTRIFYLSQFYEAQEGISDLISYVPQGKIRFFYLSADWNSTPFEVSDENIAQIRQHAEEAVQRNKPVLDEVVKLIKR